MKYSDLTRLLIEAPVGDVKSFVPRNSEEKRKTSYSKVERKWFDQEKYTKRLSKYFKHVDQTIDFYFFDLKDNFQTNILSYNQFLEMANSVFKNTPEISVEHLKSLVYDSTKQGHICMLVIGNMTSKKTSQSHNLTPWMLVHRFWQSLYDGYQTRQTHQSVSVDAKDIINEIINEVNYIVFDRRLSLKTDEVYKSIFDFRSAREGIVSGCDDLVFEILTEITLFGYIRLKSFESFTERMIELYGHDVDLTFVYRRLTGVAKNIEDNIQHMLKGLEGIVIIYG